MAHFKNSEIVRLVWPNRNIADVLLCHITTCTHTSLKFKEMNAKPAWTAQSHVPTSGFSLESWKMPTAIQKMRMIKDSREEGALSWGRNRLVLSQHTWPCLLVVKGHCDGQKWSRNTEQQVTMLYKCPVFGINYG